MKFLEHDAFLHECKVIQKKFPGLALGLEAVKRLLDKQFDPVNPIPAIGPGKLNRVTSNQVWELWKLEVAIPKSGLRPSQWPRVWLAVSGERIALLKAASHIDNYDNASCEAEAKERVTDIF